MIIMLLLGNTSKTTKEPSLRRPEIFGLEGISRFGLAPLATRFPLAIDVEGLEHSAGS